MDCPRGRVGMNKIKWFFMSYKHKLKYTMNVLYDNKQRLHLNGFVLDFDTMTIQKEEQTEEQTHSKLLIYLGSTHILTLEDKEYIK